MKTFDRLVFSLLILALLAWSGSALGNGGKGKKIHYEAGVEMDEGFVEFSAELEEIRFRLNSVKSKYKVIRIKIDNRSESTLRLSAENDKIELHFEDRVVPGILRLVEHDPELWDSFDADLRKALVYPAIVEPNEEENIFVFVPESDVDSVPRGFRYTLHSLPDEPVMLADVTAQAEA